MKADLIQDSGEEQEIFGYALTFILATGPTLIILQIMNSLCEYFTPKRVTIDDDEEDREEKISTLKTRRGQALIPNFKSMNKNRGSLSADIDIEAGPDSPWLPPRRLIEDRNCGVKLEDLPSNVSKLWESILGYSQKQELRLEDMHAVMSRDRRKRRQSRSNDRIGVVGDSKKSPQETHRNRTSVGGLIDFEFDDSMGRGKASVYTDVLLDSESVSHARMSLDSGAVSRSRKRSTDRRSASRSRRKSFSDED